VTDHVKVPPAKGGESVFRGRRPGLPSPKRTTAVFGSAFSIAGVCGAGARTSPPSAFPRCSPQR
jgi:hypothetical protein